MTLVFFEFPDEVDTYLKAHQSTTIRSASTILISLNPRTHTFLRRLGHAPETSLPYFSSDSHAETLRKSHQVSQWVWQRTRFADNWGVSFAYRQSVVWYIRLFAHHLLWLLEILHNATVRHHPHVIRACASPENNPAGHLIGPAERYLGRLVEAFGNAEGVSVELIGSATASRFGESCWEIAQEMQRFLAQKILAPAVAPAYRFHLRRVGSHHPLLFTSQQYRMGEVARLLTREKRDLSMAVMSDWGNRRVGRNGAKGESAFHTEAWLGLLDPLSKEDQASRQSLQALLNRLAVEIDGADGVFSYRGISFAGLVRRKLEQGIGPFVLSLHKRAATIQLLLDTLQPRAVLSAGSRNDDMITGELCRAAGLPAMLISHGSHVSPKSDLERIEWGEQGHRLLLAPYPCVALQSPLAEGFLKAFDSTSRGIRTGPVVWGSPVDRHRSAVLCKRMLGGRAPGHVVVHANTPKGRGGNRFHVYETPDEYVQSILDLSAAVESLPRVHLVVKFRPSREISVRDLQALVPFSNHVTLSVEEPFLDVLGFADLLVSFSSTTIEEALQNRIPVLLYGGRGRYQHVPGVEVAPGAPCPPAGVYVVKRPEHLASALRRILDTLPREGSGEDLFAPYCFEEKSRVRLVDWLAGKQSRGSADARGG